MAISVSGHVVTGAPSFPFPVRPENRISVSGPAGKPEFGTDDVATSKGIILAQAKE